MVLSHLVRIVSINKLKLPKNSWILFHQELEPVCEYRCDFTTCEIKMWGSSGEQPYYSWRPAQSHSLSTTFILQDGLAL